MSQEGDKTDQETGTIAEVDRIRDIIFGPQMRLYEQQFKRVVGQLDLLGKQFAEFKATLDERLADQESRMRKLQEDTNQRLRDLEGNITSRLGQLEAGLEQQDAQLTGRARELTAELRGQVQEVRSEFTTALNALEDEKTSRHNLGDLLVEMGTRLKEQTALADLLGQLEAATREQAAD